MSLEPQLMHNFEQNCSLIFLLEICFHPLLVQIQWYNEVDSFNMEWLAGV